MHKDIVERFIGYTKIDTTSNDSGTPSNPNEFVLAELLKQELLEIGVPEDKIIIDDNSFLYARLDSNIDKECPTVGFLAHLDTSNATSGKDVKARVIENYDGGDIELSESIWTKVEDYPSLKELKGKDIIVTDGTTLLGGDDKAGIAVIMDFVEQLINQNLPHGNIIVCFTPDEETGGGIKKIDLEHFPCDFAYTVDGGQAGEVTYESFNAASAYIRFLGNSIHPGDAKGKMINACQLAYDFHKMLPEFERPEYTEGYEGFNHLIGIKGDVQYAEAYYILRNHDVNILERQKRDFEMIAGYMNSHYGRQVVDLRLTDAYRNMIDGFGDKMYVVDIAKKATEAVGLKVMSDPVRGGTDGCELTSRGIPTPNLGNGDWFCHGNHELVDINDLRVAPKVLLKIVEEIVNRGE